MPRPYRRKSSSSRKRVEHDPNTQRINKVLASAGLGSRRDVEELIVQGRVEVDGETVTNLATRVDPRVAKIEVDGVQLKRPQLVYYALNKPKGILSTNNDPSGRARVIDFVPDRHRVFSVGRLDRYSEGLMLLTNDGDIAQRLAHPKFRVQKTYFVVVAGLLTNEELAKLKKGVYLAEGMARIDGARIRKARKTCTELEILLSEGKNREIRRILARAGHKVVLLRRIAIGTLRLAELPLGAVRELTPAEVKSLYACTERSRPAVKSAKAKQSSSEDPNAVASEKKAKAKVEKIVTPIEASEFDDFGLGLEQDYQYDESILTPSEDAIEFGASDEEDWDDDFVSDFESLSSGSVLGYDDDDSFVSSEADSAPPPRERDSHSRGGRSRNSGSSAGRRDHSASSNRSTGRGAKGTSSRGRASTEGAEGGRSVNSFGKRKPAGKRPAGFKSAARPGKSAPRSEGGRSSEGRKPMGRKPGGRSGGKPGGKSGGGSNRKNRS